MTFNGLGEVSLIRWFFIIGYVFDCQGKELIFFFFLFKVGVQKVYKENSIILYFSKKKKKNKKIYILLFFSRLQNVVHDIFFFFLSDKKNVNGFIAENQRFAFWAFWEVLRQP